MQRLKKIDFLMSASWEKMYLYAMYRNVNWNTFLKTRLKNDSKAKNNILK